MRDLSGANLHMGDLVVLSVDSGRLVDGVIVALLPEGVRVRYAVKESGRFRTVLRGNEDGLYLVKRGSR